MPSKRVRGPRHFPGRREARAGRATQEIQRLGNFLTGAAWLARHPIARFHIYLMVDLQPLSALDSCRRNFNSFVVEGRTQYRVFKTIQRPIRRKINKLSATFMCNPYKKSDCFMVRLQGKMSKSIIWQSFSSARITWHKSQHHYHACTISNA